MALILILNLIKASPRQETQICTGYLISTAVTGQITNTAGESAKLHTGVRFAQSSLTLMTDGVETTGLLYSLACMLQIFTVHRAVCPLQKRIMLFVQSFSRPVLWDSLVGHINGGNDVLLHFIALYVILRQ